MVRAHWCQSKSFLGMAGYLESLPASSAEAVGLGELPPHIPVAIFSAANSTAAQLAERDAMARRARNGKHVVTKSGHWIHLDEPELVIAAIREMIAGITG
jgi:pimeloyl-ACP methyl ester carboxylesterase